MVDNLLGPQAHLSVVFLYLVYDFLRMFSILPLYGILGLQSKKAFTVRL